LSDNSDFGGRLEGSRNKISNSIRQDFHDVFDAVGGVEGMRQWVWSDIKNRKVFYQMYAKMVTKEVVTEDKNKSHDQFVKWIQEQEAEEKKEIGVPLKLIEGGVTLAGNS
jgi:hypothetical protein